MSQGAQSLHVSGAKVAPDIQMDANASSALQHMKEQLLAYQVDNKKLSDQLNCLVSLIKRFEVFYIFYMMEQYHTDITIIVMH